MSVPLLSFFNEFEYFIYSEIKLFGDEEGESQRWCITPLLKQHNCLARTPCRCGQILLG